MNDIVKRLRKKTVAGQALFPTPLEIAAADEIERLCNANQDLVDERDIFKRALDKRDTEIERLRGLLREALDNEAAVSTIGIDSETLNEYRVWDADDWNERVREALRES